MKENTKTLNRRRDKPIFNYACVACDVTSGTLYRSQTDKKGNQILKHMHTCIYICMHMYVIKQNYRQNKMTNT